jgi:hypothetical protein
VLPDDFPAEYTAVIGHFQTLNVQIKKLPEPEFHDPFGNITDLK